MGTSTISPTALANITDPEVKWFLEQKWDLVEEHFAPIHCILFGSRFNGKTHEWSDIDLIVVSERFAEIPFVNRGCHFKNVVQPRTAMDVLCYTPEEFE